MSENPLPMRKTIQETLAGKLPGEPHSPTHLKVYGDTALPAHPNKDGAVGRKKGVPNKITVEGRNYARKFTDHEKWDKMIWFWIDNPELMPPGVFNTLMAYRFGKPVQTVKVKGEIMARPYLGESKEELAARARALAARLQELSAQAEAIDVEARVLDSADNNAVEAEKSENTP